MPFFNRAGYTRAFRQGPCRQIKTTLHNLWDAYSKPAPETFREGLTLLCLCSAVAAVTGSFLFQWMSQVLKYDQLPSATAAGLYAVSAFFLLPLVHPLRCALTLVLPSLGTKQGRKLIISTSVMLLVLNVVPNIAANVGVVAHVLRCTASSLAHSLITSSELVDSVKGDLVKEAWEPSSVFAPRLREFDQDTNINLSEVKQRFVDVSHLKAGEPWLLDLPSTSISIVVNYKVQSYSPITCVTPITCIKVDVVKFKQRYAWNFSFMSEHCTLEPSKPDVGVTVTLGLLYLLAYTMVLLEVYARRARRKVSASFFPRKERKRTEFIFKKILTRREKQKDGIFFVETVHGSDFCKPEAVGKRLAKTHLQQ
ncbi:hypothetical protein SKAU_G00099150 [Synaphobranchus kaupii]|uniref:Dendritic cell-specific transmembrane protein-like domain-containing protein n=1 Tax=Synaphobranchus kaupii TaxID=118154 RepID=A0A9Q1J675_SYNKA|nr:hypothetical protein SKAU_G00099150 [Synaphobranchus kaupii]